MGLPMKISDLQWLLLATAMTSSAVLAADEHQLIVQDVVCLGNTAVSCQFIRSHLNLSAGMPLDELEVRNAELRLSSLRNFESVDVRLEKGTERDTVVVVLEVTEADATMTEALVGVSSRLDSTRSVVAGRLARQNFFGEGNTLDLAVVAVTPIDGDAYDEDYEIHLRYAIPNLFGARDYFGVMRASWINARREDVHGNFSDFDGSEFDLRVGRRFRDFSYFTLGATFRPGADWIFGEWDGENDFDVTLRDELFGFNVIYGWNSEDDLYFPTEGSSFHIGAGWDFGSGSPKNRSHVQFRKTWRVWDGLFTVKLGGAPSPEYRVSFDESQLLSISYGKPLRGGDHLKRGRWYIEPGIGEAGIAPDGERIYEVGIKVGMRLDTVAFGIVDLYLMGTQDPER